MKFRPALLIVTVTLAVAALLVIGPKLLPPPHVIILVRHAEKADSSPDSALSPAGEARARHLADVVGPGVRAIYVSEYRRTQQTAQPTAQRLGLTPVVVPAGDSAALLQKLRDGRNKNITLVVGHSNTVPALIKELGVAKSVQIQESEFDNLYIVVTHWSGPPTLIHQRY